ncbi:MAG: type II restriction enzyme [Brevinematia bacterium]
MRKKAEKKDIIVEIFNTCKERDNFVFDNSLVKEVMGRTKSQTNPYDMTKVDDSNKLPEKLISEDYCVIHLGGGKHQFFKGIEKVFHKFESIEESEKIEWPYRPSILNDFSVSESSVLSLCFNQRIIHDFLYLDIVANPKIYNSERKRGISFEYFIDGVKMQFENLQIEIDLTAEYNGYVTVFEGKNTRNEDGWIKDFNVFQLYNPFRYYYELKEENKLNISQITACYKIEEDGRFYS